MRRVRQLSQWAWLNVVGLVLAALGMVLQIAAGSELYPTLTGPIVLVAAAVFVVLGPAWARYVGLIVPVVLGIGAIVASAMTGAFINQLIDFGNLPIVLGSVMHVLGLAAAIAGGVGVLVDNRGTVNSER